MKGAPKGTQSIVEFEDEKICILINHKVVSRQGGWKLRPLNPPVVIITHIDCVTYTMFFSACAIRYKKRLLIAFLLKGELLHVKYEYGRTKTGRGLNHFVIK